MARQFLILHGPSATTLETTACVDLKEDLTRVTGRPVTVRPVETPDPGRFLEGVEPGAEILVVGTPNSHPWVERWADAGQIPVTRETPGKRGGCVTVVTRTRPPHLPVLVLAGSDPQGAQYAAYDFSRRDLGVEPWNFWTGYEPAPRPDFSVARVPPRVIPPPAVPILAYFDNDNDELANMTRPYLEFSREHWHELVKSLVRLKYNAIDLHDHLGRAEFYRWEHYLELVPDYEPNAELLDHVIDYAHARGVMIQVSFYLGWKFKAIDDNASLNWAKHQDAWVETWRYYLEHTPIGKCDIFLNRPRDQRWDKPYRGKGDPVDVFNAAFPAMAELVKAHNPAAIVIVDLYSEGRGVFERGFRPEPKDEYVMAWPDDGFGRFEYLPADRHGYRFGIYVHAGYYLNHVVQEPYPGRLARHVKRAVLEHDMTHYCLVNGQTVRHFLLNLEACACACDDPRAFDPDAFLRAWVARYFGPDVVDDVIAILADWRAAQRDGHGYVRILQLVDRDVTRARWCRRFPLLKGFIRKQFAKRCDTGPALTARVRENVATLRRALERAEAAAPRVTDQCHFFHDHVALPVTLLLQANQILLALQEAAYADDPNARYARAAELVRIHTRTRRQGDKNPRWATWYDPRKRRPNGGYPSEKHLWKLAGRRPPLDDSGEGRLTAGTSKKRRDITTKN